MSADGTLELLLRATQGGAGSATLGDARIVYTPEHPQYESVRTHLGGIEPGETKPVPPWPSE